MGASSQESRLERGNQGPPATPRAHAACPAPPGRQHAAGCGVAGAPLWTLRSPDPRQQGCDHPMTPPAPASVAPLRLPRRGHEGEHPTARARWKLAVAVFRAALRAALPRAAVRAALPQVAVHAAPSVGRARAPAVVAVTVPRAAVWAAVRAAVASSPRSLQQPGLAGHPTEHTVSGGRKLAVGREKNTDACCLARYLIR